MNCKNCGANLNETDKFCQNCGAPVQNVAQNINQNSEGNSFTYERPTNQPQSNVQQSHNQQLNYRPQNNYGASNQRNMGGNMGDKKTMVPSLAVIIAVTFLIALIIICFFVTSSKKNPAQSVNAVANTSVTPNNTVPAPVATATPTPSIQVDPVSNGRSSGYKVSFGGFDLVIPDTLIYEVMETDGGEKVLAICDTNQTWLVQSTIEECPFQTLKQNKSQLNSVLSESMASVNPTVSPATVEEINGVECIVLEADLAGTKELCVFVGLNSMYTMIMDVFSIDNEFDRSILKEIVPIIKSAEYTGDKSFIKSENKIDHEKIGEALKKVVEAPAN